MKSTYHDPSRLQRPIGSRSIRQGQSRRVIVYDRIEASRCRATEGDKTECPDSDEAKENDYSSRNIVIESFPSKCLVDPKELPKAIWYFALPEAEFVFCTAHVEIVFRCFQNAEGSC